MKIFINKTQDVNEFSPLLLKTRYHDLPFHFEKDKWQFVNSAKEADIIPLLTVPLPYYESNVEKFVTVQEQYDYIKPLSANQYLVIMMHTHCSDFMNEHARNAILEKYLNYHKNIITVDINRKVDNQIHMYNDFVFNFVKAYFTEYDRFDLSDRLWTYSASKQSFLLPEIKELKITKRFLIPNVIRSSAEYKEHVRQRIKDEIIQDDDCFYSDLPNDIQLLPQEERLISTVDKNGAGITPMSNHYYIQSPISVYSETICTGKYNVNCINEKTFIPLIKGHFILPFGYQGLIQDILSYGFKLPNWIDYSYDTISNDEDRLDTFLTSVKKLRQLSLGKLNELANKDIALREHNRLVFYFTPYDSLYDKIKKIIYQNSI